MRLRELGAQSWVIHLKMRHSGLSQTNKPSAQPQIDGSRAAGIKSCEFRRRRYDEGVCKPLVGLVPRDCLAGFRPFLKRAAIALALSNGPSPSAVFYLKEFNVLQYDFLDSAISLLEYFGSISPEVEIVER